MLCLDSSIGERKKINILWDRTLAKERQGTAPVVPIWTIKRVGVEGLHSSKARVRKKNDSDILPVDGASALGDHEKDEVDEQHGVVQPQRDEDDEP